MSFLYSIERLAHIVAAAARLDTLDDEVNSLRRSVLKINMRRRKEKRAAKDSGKTVQAAVLSVLPELAKHFLASSPPTPKAPKVGPPFMHFCAPPFSGAPPTSDVMTMISAVTTQLQSLVSYVTALNERVKRIEEDLADDDDVEPPPAGPTAPSAH